jgi:hypothetical protein
MEYNEAAIERYFSKDYRQYVDGKELDLKGFYQHIKVQKETLAAVHIEFKTIAQENEIVFTNHLVHIKTKEGRMAIVHVIAEFHLYNNKIIYCNELTRLLRGDERERDVGSR